MTKDRPSIGQLVLRHASKRSSGTWGPDDYDVIQDGRDIGGVFSMPALACLPIGPWMWTITRAVMMPALPSHGFCASLDEAKAKFAETWRAWLTLTPGSRAEPARHRRRTENVGRMKKSALD
jgi:hypothetical protein